MAGRIVVDVRTLAGNAQELNGLSGQLDAQAYELRRALGFLIGRPDIPNQAALMASYTSATQTLDAAALMSGQMSTAVARHAQRVLDCENGLLRSGDGPTVRPGAGRAAVGLPSLAPLAGMLEKLLSAYGVAGALATAGKGINLLPALTLRGLAGGAKVVRLLNNGSLRDLAAVNGIGEKGAQAIIDGRKAGRYRTPGDVARALTDAQTRDAIRGLRKGPGGGSLGTTGPLGDLAARLGARIRGLPVIGRPLGAVSRFSGSAGAGIAAKLRPFAPAAKVAGKVLAPLDVAMSTKGAWDAFHDGGKGSKDLLGPDWVEDSAAVGGVVVSVAGAAVAFGLVANPVGIAVVAGAAVGLVAYQYGPRAWRAAEKYGGRVVDWAGDRAGDVKDYASDKADDVKDYASHKVSGAKKKISGWFH
jgi:hypothetical protein